MLRDDSSDWLEGYAPLRPALRPVPGEWGDYCETLRTFVGRFPPGEVEAARSRRRDTRRQRLLEELADLDAEEIERARIVPELCRIELEDLEDAEPHTVTVDIPKERDDAPQT